MLPLTRLSPIQSFRAVAQLLADWLAATAAEKMSAQPGTVFFAKGVLDKEEDGEKVPDGSSLAYIKLAADLFLERGSEQQEGTDLPPLLLRTLQRDVTFTCVAERYLIDRLGTPK